MGVREIEGFLEQWQMDSRDLRLADDSVAHSPGAGTVVRNAAASPGLDRLGHGRGTGKEPSHRRPVGCRLRRGRTRSLDIRAVREFPRVLGEGQQAALKAVVQGSPAESGIELANWNWRAVRQFVLEHFGIGLNRSSYLNYLPRSGVCL